MLWDSGILDGVFVCVLFHNTADVLALSCRYNRTLSLTKGSLIIHTQFFTSHVGDVENAKTIISSLSLSCFSVCLIVFFLSPCKSLWLGRLAKCSKLFKDAGVFHHLLMMKYYILLLKIPNIADKIII